MSRMILFSCTFIAMLAFATSAQAGFISDVFQPFSTDASVQQLLRPMFGGLVDSALGSGEGGNATVLTRIIKFEIEFIVLPFGGFLLLYSLYHGLSTSALSGELYGDKKSAYWIAVRTVIGFGMVTPAGGLKGLALGNIFLMWLTLSGVGAASSLWNVVVDEVTKNPIILTSSSPDTELFDVMLMGEMCAAIYNNAATEDHQVEIPADQLKIYSVLLNDDKKTKFGWTKPGGNGKSDGGCGHITIDRTADIEVTAHVLGTSKIGSVQAAKIAGNQVRAEMQAQTDSTLNALQTRAHEVAEAYIASGNVIGADHPPVESYFALMQWFKSQQQQAAKSIAESAMPDVSNAFKANARQEGWITAGFYFLGMSTFQQAINHSINMDWVSGTATNLDRVLSRVADERYHSRVRNQWILMEGYINAGHQQIAAGRSLPATVTDLDNVGSDAMAWVGKQLNDQVVASINSNATPLAAAVDIGSTLIDIGTGLAGGGWVVNKVSRFIPGIGGVAAGWAGDKAWELGKSAWWAGLAFTIVGLLPALAWGRRIAHWFIRTVVAQVAGPMWLIMHVHHAGDGFEGNAGNGYRLALQLVLAPVLDITALAIVYALMIVFTPFMNAVIMPLVLDLGGGTLTLVVMFLILGANVWLVFTLLALFESIEHEVLAFVGGRGSDLSMDQNTDKNRMMAMMAFVNKKMPMPNLGGGKKDNNAGGGGASITGDTKSDLGKVPKITTDKLLPKDK